MSKYVLHNYAANLTPTRTEFEMSIMRRSHLLLAPNNMQFVVWIHVYRKKNCCISQTIFYSYGILDPTPYEILIGQIYSALDVAMQFLCFDYVRKVRCRKYHLCDFHWALITHTKYPFGHARISSGRKRIRWSVASDLVAVVCSISLYHFLAISLSLVSHSGIYIYI